MDRKFPKLQLPSRRSKTQWPNPEESVGKRFGLKGDKTCWEAIGPARAAFKEISPEIKEVLTRNCGPVPNNLFVAFDIFMIGTSPATAKPHLMFACPKSAPRKDALAQIRKSKILSERCPGIETGHWNYPPHIIAPHQMGYTQPNSPTSPEPTSPRWQSLLSSSKLEIQLTPILSNGVEGAERLHINEADDPLRSLDRFVRTSGMATAGAVWRFNGIDFLLVPNHSLPEERQSKLDLILEEEDEDAEDAGMNETNEGSDDECEFGGFDEANSPRDDDVDITSQYSQSPAPSNDGSVSDLENSFKDQSTDSSDEQQDSESLPMGVHAETPTTMDRSTGEAFTVEDVNETRSVIESQRLIFDGRILIRSSDLDYALIDINREVGALPLPILTEDDLKPIQEGDHSITTITSNSGEVRGILSGAASQIKLPNSETYQEVYTCKLFGALQRGDCGSIVRDSASGVIYGHVVAGSSMSRIAYVIPAINVLKDIQEQVKEIQWSEPQTQAPNTNAAFSIQRPRYRAIERWFHEDSPWNGRNLRQESLLDPRVIAGLEAHRHSPSGSSAFTAQTSHSSRDRSRASSAPTDDYPERVDGTEAQAKFDLDISENKKSSHEEAKIQSPSSIPGVGRIQTFFYRNCARCYSFFRVSGRVSPENRADMFCETCNYQTKRSMGIPKQAESEASTNPDDTSPPDMQTENQLTEDEQRQEEQQPQQLTPTIPNESPPPASTSENTSRIAHLEQMLADVSRENNTMDEEIAYLTAKIDYLEHVEHADSTADYNARLPALLYQTGVEMDRSDYVNYLDHQQSAAVPYDAESAVAYKKAAAGSPFGLEWMSQGPRQAF